MPTWLQVTSRLNPLTYQVDALRGLMLIGGTTTYSLGLDIVILLVTATGLTLLCARLYPRIVM